MGAKTVSEIRAVLRRIYAHAGFLERFRIVDRPLICPFHVLIEQVPAGSSVLDVGCGSGIFLNLLAALGRISKGVGIDAALPSLESARRANRETGTSVSVTFQHRAVEEGLPEGPFDVVSMCDVIHHIRPAEQRRALEGAADRVAADGLLVVKDIAKTPLWRAFANRIHDLILARQWINYVGVEDMIEWMAEAGLTLQHRDTIDMWWYRHELLVFRRLVKPPGRATALRSI